MARSSSSVRGKAGVNVNIVPFGKEMQRFSVPQEVRNEPNNRIALINLEMLIRWLILIGDRKYKMSG